MNIKALILCLVAASPLTANATSLVNNFELSKQCHQLSIELDKLYSVEDVPFCKEKIRDAGYYIEMAAETFFEQQNDSANAYLKTASKKLAYTTVERCTQENNILAAKNDLDKILDSLH